MRQNGSPEPDFETDSNRSYFLAKLPIHDQVKPENEEGVQASLNKTGQQYEEYCNTLEELEFSENSEEKEDEIELLNRLIEDWDKKHFLGSELDPVELIKS